MAPIILALVAGGSAVSLVAFTLAVVIWLLLPESENVAYLAVFTATLVVMSPALVLLIVGQICDGVLVESKLKPLKPFLSALLPIGILVLLLQRESFLLSLVSTVGGGSMALDPLLLVGKLLVALGFVIEQAGLVALVLLVALALAELLSSWVFKRAQLKDRGILGAVRPLILVGLLSVVLTQLGEWLATGQLF